MTFSSAAEQIRAGKVLALAVSTEKRIPNFPDIPTFREVGQDLVAATWFSLSGPARLPSDIVEKTSRETLKAMQLPDVQKRLALDAIESRLMSPAEFTKFVEAETARWAPIAKQLAATNPCAVVSAGLLRLIRGAREARYACARLEGSAAS